MKQKNEYQTFMKKTGNCVNVVVFWNTSPDT